MGSLEWKLQRLRVSEPLNCCSVPKSHSTVTPMQDFDVLKTLSRGRFSNILLVRKRQSPNSDRMVLKAFHYDDSSTMDIFQRELSTTYMLSPHPNIVTSFNVSYTWDGSLVFPLEFAQYGDLRKYLKKNKSMGSGMRDDSQIKLIIKQIASALEFMHLSFQIVHGNVKPENILIFSPDFFHVKLSDFGSAETVGNQVPLKDCGDPSYMSPEIINVLPGEKYYVSMASDAWQLGILLYYCIHARAPWTSPDVTDRNYRKYSDWFRRKSFRMPSSFTLFTPRLVRLMKRLLEPKPTKRYEVKEVFKYLKDDWLVKPNKLALLRRKSETILNQTCEFSGRSRSGSASPGITGRRASNSTGNVSEANSNENLSELRSSLKNPNKIRSFKTVKFDISSDDDDMSPIPNGENIDHVGGK